MYKLYKVNSPMGVYESIIRLTDMAQIPINPDNTDYQAYLRWLEAGNTPEPAEENQ